jgi:predicted lipoprotein with Yx(FWY)xxD motif
MPAVGLGIQNHFKIMTIRNSIKSFSNLSALLSFSVVFLFLGFSSCDKADDAAPKYSINLTSSGSLGKILTDADGRTLYYFANDYNGQSSCSGGCLTAWPVFHQSELEIHPDLTKDDFSTITRADGTLQTTYKGWPLYYFATGGKTEDAGVTGGQAIDGVWFVVKTDYAVMYTNTQLIGVDGNKYKSDFTVGEGVTKFFSDDHGRTIYLFGRDHNATNTFTTSTYTNNATWPIFYVDVEKTSLPGSLQKSDFGVITVGSENRKQSTYKGWPLYYFGQDVNRGSNRGVSVPAPTAPPLWHIVNAATTVAPN